MSGFVFRLPDLGEGLTEAEVVEWHVAVGDEVSIDEEVVTVETAKASVDVPCPYAGTVAELHAGPGTVLAVGEPLITVGDVSAAAEPVPAAEEPAPAGPAPATQDHAGEQYRSEERAGATVPADGDDPEDQPERPLIGYGAGDAPARRRRGGRRRAGRGASADDAASATTPDTAPASATTSSAPDTSSDGRRAVRVISPLVRRLATEWGIDVRTVQPGPTGVVRRADLEAAREARSAATVETPAAGTAAAGTTAAGTAAAETVPADGGAERADQRVPIQGVHRIMVDRLTTSRREIPDATTWVDVDATRLMKLKDSLREARPDARIGVLPLLARIVVAGLARHPELNASVDVEAGEIVQHGAVNLGFAAQSPRGLVVPVVHDADTMSTAELASALRELTTLAREGKLSPTQMSGGTFTLNNYGVYGVDGSTPIINHPEAGMLGVGRIVEKPWAHKGRVRLRQVTQLSFTFDHRVCDGGTAGGFLRYVADCVERPGTLLADL
ncbi:dihydrolipoamide acetyltransferase family protein [Ornithinimicrobium kibberense]|uniref:Dihydrolipoamide acetyltransferase component of pyruvate dehydrogenase complex n=1 Tax=Ornithinimicrobium kibberense TaxID=282060 RepID=A0ABV5V598_9MICO|nr:dihydrolipoamide acetyltransferase family protein [Ornithinimicrobium kibberense]